MYILFDLIKSAWGIVRKALLFLDSVGVTFIDNIYNLMISAISAFDGSKIAEVAGDITKNCYIIIGIFALFRIALILINTIIDPEKFSDKNTNIGNMLSRIVIVVVLLVAVPFVFSKSRELQNMIVNNNYISKLLIGTSITNSSEDADSDKGGAYIKDLVVRALIYPDENLAQIKTDESKTDESGETTQVSTEYECIDKSNPACVEAVAAWNNDVSLLTLDTYIGKYVEEGDEATYVYHYTPLIMLVVGGFVTWVLLSFTIDIAVRTVQLMVLEILSPLFIVTYIDPKASSNGPFKKWLTECGKTYVSLFIKIAIICLMIFFISKIDDLLGAATQNTSFFSMTRLLMLIAILIFAKKAPKWLGNMIGVEGDLGGLGIGKKLGEMAMLGGIASKGIESAKKFTGQKAKNFGANRVRNTAARIGAMKETHKANKEAKKNGTYNKSDNTSLWKQGRAAAKESRQANWGKDAQGLLKDIGGGFMSGRLNVNPEAKSLNAKMKDNAEKSALKYNERIGNTEADKALKAERAANNKEAKRLYNDVAMDSKTGDRLKVKNAKGENVYVNPRGTKEMNAAFGNPKTEFEAYGAYGTNLAISKGFKIDGSGRVIDNNGKVIASSAQEYGLSNMSYAGQLAVKSLVADNAKDTVARYTDSKQQVVKASQDYSQAVIQYNQAVSSFSNDPNVQEAASVITKYENITNDPKFVELASKDRSTLTQEEQVKLSGYLSEIDSMQADYSNAKSEYDAARDSYGIEKIKTNLDEAKKRVEDWSAEVSKLEKQISKTSAPAFDDSGKVKRDSSGNIVMENPYTVEINGEKLSPVDNFVRINEIQNMLSIKASKAKSKYDDAMKEPDSSK